jgi:hypothetical protein
MQESFLLIKMPLNKMSAFLCYYSAEINSSFLITGISFNKKNSSMQNIACTGFHALHAFAQPEIEKKYLTSYRS